MAFNTGNPVGSTDPRDFSDNAENFDKASVGSSATFNDRLGVPRKSLAGMEAEFNADQSARSTVFINFLNSSGYEFLGEYAASIEVTAYNQIIRESGEFWRPAASTTLPYTTTGAGMPEGGAFVAVGDAALRQELGSGVFRADLLTNLESTPGRFDGDSARLMGRSALSDGGEGNFRWDSSDLSSTLVLSSVTSTSVNDTTDTITSTAHGLEDGDGVVAQSAVNGLSTNTVYWVVNATNDTFQLSETFRGSAFDLIGTTNFTVDNLFDPLKGIYVTSTTDLTGTGGAWVRQHDGIHNPLWYGAKRDGVTDDSAAIQFAITHGATIFIPAGDYIANDLYAAGGKHIFGANDLVNSGTRLKAGSNGTNAVISAHQPRTFIELLVIDGGGLDGFTNRGFDTDGTVFSNANFDIRLEKVLFQNCKNNAIRAFNANHFSMRHCTLNSNDTATMCVLDQTFVASVIECEFQTTDQVAIEVKNGTSVGNTRIEGCWFENLTNDCIISDLTYQTHILNNKFLCPSLPAAKACVRIQNSANASTIAFNTFQNFGSGEAVILDSSAVDVKIVRNTGITYSGAPLTVNGVDAGGATSVYVEAIGRSSALFARSEGGGWDIGVLKMDEDAPSATLNDVNFSISGADRFIERLSSGRLVLRSEASEVQMRGNATRILKANGGNGTFAEGYLVLSGNYLWVDTTGDLRISPTAPTSDTDGVVVGTQT